MAGLIHALPSFDPQQCPNGTSLQHLTPIGTGDEHFLARLMLFFNVQWDIFDKQVPQAVA